MVVSSIDEQRGYQDKVPLLNIPNEMFNQFEGLVSKTWKEDSLPLAFSLSEIRFLGDFSIVSSFRRKTHSHFSDCHKHSTAFTVHQDLHTNFLQDLREREAGLLAPLVAFSMWDLSPMELNAVSEYGLVLIQKQSR